jgi:hypothetical protein
MTCPLRTRSSGQRRALTVAHETDAMTVNCISAALAGYSRSLLSSGSRDNFVTPFMRAALHWVLLATRNRQILTCAAVGSASGPPW